MRKFMSIMVLCKTLCYFILGCLQLRKRNVEFEKENERKIILNEFNNFFIIKGQNLIINSLIIRYILLNSHYDFNKHQQ